MEPLKSSLQTREEFDRDLEKKFVSSIKYGEHKFDLTTHVKFNTEDATIARYAKGPRCKNIDGQYILLEVPDAAVTSKFQIKHDLKRVPTGVRIVQQAGISASGKVRTLYDGIYSLVSYPDNAQNWNNDTITLSAVRIYASGAYPQRMVLIIT